MTAGLYWAVAFVALETLQYTVFGGLMQGVDPVRFAAWSGLAVVVAFAGRAAIFAQGEVRAALGAPGALIGINLLNAVGWGALLLSVRQIEPAVAYTVGAAVMPFAVWVAALAGATGAAAPRNGAEKAGVLLMGLCVVVLTVVVLSGQSGFARGGTAGAALGLGAAAAEGVIFTIVVLIAGRLNARGVGPGALFGLRFVLFAALALMLAGRGEGAADPTAAWLALIGVALIAPPLYALQRAIATASAMTVAVATAFGPLAIFALQIAEGRFAPSGFTLAGLTVYTTGALIAARGAWAAERAG